MVVESETKERVVIFPHCKDPQDAQFVTFTIPRNRSEKALFLISPSIGILQLQHWENNLNSWFVGTETVSGLYM